MRLIILFLAALCSFGAERYVSTSGSNSNNGTIGSPWLTIQHALNNSSCGDVINVRAGTYSRFVAIGFDPGSGYSGTSAPNCSAGNPLTIRAYPGETVTWGNDMSWANTSRNRHMMIEIRNRTGYIIEGITFSHSTVPGTSDWWTYGIELVNADNTIIRGNTFTGNNTFRPGGTVISQHSVSDDVLIEENTFQFWPCGSDLMGVTLECVGKGWCYKAEGTALPNNDAVIRNNLFRGMGGDGVQVAPFGGNNTLIEDNEFDGYYVNQGACNGNGTACSTVENAIDIKRSDFTTIRRNLIYNFRRKDSDVGAAIVVHLLADDVTIEDNIIHNVNLGIRAARNDEACTSNYYGDWYCRNQSEQYGERLTIRRNLLYNITNETIFGAYPGLGVAFYFDSYDDLKVHHNTIAFVSPHPSVGGTPQDAVKISSKSGTCTAGCSKNNEFVNNIFLFDTASQVRVWMDEGEVNFPNTTIGSNLWYNLGGGQMCFIAKTTAGGGSYQSVYSVNDFKSMKSGTNAAGSLQSNPLFVNATTNPATADYTLQSGSPAINSGTTISGETYVGAADMGAFEFGLTSGTAPTITTTTLPDGTVGASYSQTLAATGDTPITWSVESGSLPAGLSLNASTGEISGTATTVETGSFTAQATNDAGTDTQALSITINAVPPTITTSSLPDGDEDQPYSQTLTADGTGPFTWSVTVGSLPAGLSLNSSTGAITGTPTAAGTASFTVQASNSAGSDTQELSITIDAAPPPRLIVVIEGSISIQGAGRN